MILSTKDDCNKDGSDLPMFSRSGKSTISSYLAFSQHTKKPVIEKPIDPLEQNLQQLANDDLGLVLGDKAFNVKASMQKIADDVKRKAYEAKIKKRSFGPNAKDYMKPQPEGTVKPIDFLKNVEFRRNV